MQDCGRSERLATVRLTSFVGFFGRSDNATRSAGIVHDIEAPLVRPVNLPRPDDLTPIGGGLVKPMRSGHCVSRHAWPGCPLAAVRNTAVPASRSAPGHYARRGMEAAVATHLDVQAQRPRVEVSLSCVGVTGVEKVIRIGRAADQQLFSVHLECLIDLSPQQKGAHMSRFEEVVNDVIGEVMLGESELRAEQLAVRIAEEVRTRQQARRAEVGLTARYPEYKPAPVSGVPTQEIYTLYGRALASEHGARRVIGVSAQGMTACPCAQEHVAARARARLFEQGFSEGDVARILEAVPVATHNQRGIGTLHIGLPEQCHEDIDAAILVEIVEASMSSEIYELMKRSDEASVVESAHRHARFVEDCVREMIRGTLEQMDQLGDTHFISARQVNKETIHQHDVVAERFGVLGEIRHELATGQRVRHHTTLREWLTSDVLPGRD
jgi:GTP cyclohydrolase IV